MGLLTVNKENNGEDAGILYLIEIDVIGEGKFVKVGLTTKSDPERRWWQIGTSIWKAYREGGLPNIKPKRFRKVPDVSLKEKQLLDYLSEYQDSPKKKIDGRTEMHRIDLELAKDAYELVYNGKELPTSEEICPHCEKPKKFKSEGKACCGHKCEEKICGK